MSDFSQRLGALSPEQRAVFERKLNQLKQQKKREAPRLIRRDDTGPFPLSLDQE